MSDASDPTGSGPGDASGLQLSWPGKFDAEGRRVPLQRRQPHAECLERYGVADPEASADRSERCDQLWIGDNLDVLDALADELQEGIDLVIIDPPFGTGGKFDVVTRVGEADAEGKVRQLVRPAYDDRFPGGAAGLVAMLDPRLRFIHRMLSPTGSLYLHLDATYVHPVKLLCDEIFGARCFQRQIVWRIGWLSGFKTRARNWIRNHDVILYYTKDPKRFTFHKQYVPHPEGYRRRDGKPPTGPGMPISDVWNADAIEAALTGADSLDSIQIKSLSTEKTGYATQKNESLLRRIVGTSSSPGDLVADFFCGSGTTLAVARAMGRRVLGADVGRAAIDLSRKRLVQTEGEVPVEVWSLQRWARERDREGAGEALRATAPAGTTVLDAVQTVTADALATKGRTRPRVVGWHFELAATVVAVGDDAVEVGGAGPRPPALWQGQRPLVYARTRGEPGAVLSWPRLQVRLQGLRTRALQVTLLGLDDPDVPEELAALRPSRLDLVDAWAVGLDDDGTACAPTLLARDHHRRALPRGTTGPTLTGRGPWMLRIVAFDVLARRSELCIELVAAGRGCAIASATLRG